MVCRRSRPEWAALLGVALGCSAPDKAGSAAGDTSAEVVTCDAVDPIQVAVLREMWFARPEDGASKGVDLDGENSVTGGGSGCGVGDHLDPETGMGGIDNAFGPFLPALELTEGAALEVYMQDLINSGEILILVEMEGVDDPADDDCVNVNLLRSQGEPTLGTDGLIASHQTFDRDPELPTSRAEGVSFDNGRLNASPLEIGLPFQIFDIEHTFTLHESTLRFDQGTDEAHSGILAGGVNKVDIISLVEGRTDIEIGDLIITFVNSQADLWPDENGECQGISIVFEFNATPAFIFLDE
jgi:hypothetical protein